MLTDLPGIASTLPSAMTRPTATASVGSSVYVLGGVLVALRALGNPSMAVSAVCNSVESVSRLGIPSQVLQSVVRRVSVVVAGLHPLRAGAVKGLQDKPVDEKIHHLPVSCQPDPQVPIRHEARYLHPSPPNVCPTTPTVRPNPISTSDLPKVRDLVIRMPNYGLPHL